MESHLGDRIAILHCAHAADVNLAMSRSAGLVASLLANALGGWLPTPDMPPFKSSMFMGCPVSLPRDDCVRLPDCLAFVAGSFQAFVCYFCPKLFQHPAGCFVRMFFGVIRSPGYFAMPFKNLGEKECRRNRCQFVL